VDFEAVRRGFLPSVFPCMPKISGLGLSYYWTLCQAEIAKDYIFKSGDDLRALMEDLQLHALITGKGERILKYFGSPVRADRQPFKNTHPEIISRTNV